VRASNRRPKVGCGIPKALEGNGAKKNFTSTKECVKKKEEGRLAGGPVGGACDS